MKGQKSIQGKSAFGQQEANQEVDTAGDGGRGSSAVYHDCGSDGWLLHTQGGVDFDSLANPEMCAGKIGGGILPVWDLHAPLWRLGLAEHPGAYPAVEGGGEQGSSV